MPARFLKDKLVKRDNFTIFVGGIAIKGRMLSPSSGQAKRKRTVVLCHGIPGGTRDPEDPGYAHLAEVLVNDGHCVAFFNFRGTGESAGDFDILGWVNDLREVLRWVRSRSLRSPVLFGFSAGGAVSVCAAAQESDIGGLILCGCPAEFSEILVHRGLEQFLEHARAIGIIRDTSFPADLEAWANGFRAVCAGKKIAGCGEVPKLIVHGDDDDVVPVRHAYQLYENASPPKKLAIIERGGHRLRLNEEAMSLVRQWLTEIQGSGQ
jgi:alpha/beta superfamily hydrolase